MRAAEALLLRALRDARARTISFACLFGLYAYVQAVGYQHAYPTLAQRLSFVRSFASNDAIRLFYGYPYDAATVGGYSAWRVGGTLAIVAAAFGLLAAARALRGEEDAGRMELVLANPVSRRTAHFAATVAVALCIASLWLAELLGFLAAALPLGESAYLALASASVAAVFAGVGALVGQLAPTRRLTLEIGFAIAGATLLLRVIADTSSGLGWVRWATPLGWAEEMRPFTGAEPAVLLAPVAASALLLALAARIAATRDVGTGVLRSRDSAEPRLGGLSSAATQALRSERGSLVAWMSSIGAFALVLGLVAASVSSAGIPKSLRRELAKLGSGSIATPSGYLSFVFVFFVLAVALFACAQVGAARREEAEERLETLFALPLGRARWLSGRLLLAAAGAIALSLLAGTLTWAGAVSQGVGVSLPQMLQAGANCLPVALLFLGIATLAYAILPRASAGIAYGLVTISFLWQLVGSLVGVPSWLVKMTPFAHVGLVPAQPFRVSAALAMAGIGLAAALAGLALFRRRDLMGA